MSPNKFGTMLHRRTKITRVLTYAVLEWTLISLLLLNSLFSFFILKFALYFGLKPPCILCSRLDHLLDSKRKGSKKVSSYTDLICDEHAAEISKIGYCSHHRKLIESQVLCSGCSSLSSSQQTHNQEDSALIRWMNDIGIGRAEDDDDEDLKKCSCCGAVINPIKSFAPYVNYVANLITEREFDGCFADQDMVLDDTKSGYQVLDDEEEEESESDEDVVSEAEKVPLLSLTEGEINRNVEIFSTHNLCPDMLPQHLEFYIDHCDYRLIPIELIGEEIRIVGEHEKERIITVEDADEKGEIREVSKEFDLVFEGDELLADCGFTKNEEEEIATRNLSIFEDVEANVVGQKEISRENDMGFEGDELLGGCKMLKRHLSSIQEEESAILDLCILESEDGETNVENLIAVQAGHEQSIQKNPDENLQSVEEDPDENLQSVEENPDENVQSVEENPYENLQSVEENSDEKLWSVDQIPGENLQTKLTQEENEVEGVISSEIQEEEKKMKEDSQVLVPLKEEEKREIESEQILHIEEEDDQGADTESQATIDIHSATRVHEETECQLRIEDEIDITERNQDQTENRLFELDESPTPCDFVISAITNDAVVCEVSTSSKNLHSTDEQDKDAETQAGHYMGTIAERNVESLRMKVTASTNEVEEERIPDTPTSTESFHHLHKKMLLLARKGSLTEESLDGSILSEQDGVDGAATMEKLKLELHAERKTLRALYSELEEERNAAAVAANQTMAMITRLQEEKATMQMEALQYQRMMEEQSEYDQEALQMMNELMVKREKEKQELEKELEAYRKKVMDYEEREKIRILNRRREGSMRSRNSSASCSYGEESDGLSIDLNHDTKDQEEDNGSPNGHEENGRQDTPTDAVLCLHDSLASFEDERLSILEQLKVLEEKLFILAEEEEEHIDNMKPLDQFYEENVKDFDDSYNDHSDVNGGENDLPHLNGKHQDSSRLNGSMPKRLLPLFDAAEFSESPDRTFDVKGEAFDTMLNKSPITNFELEKKRLAIEEEVDNVYERLQALEADREFLKHCIGSLRKGDKGLDLLQEILQHLRDLKSVELQALKSTDHPCISV